jgi:hypothetical protein
LGEPLSNDKLAEKLLRVLLRKSRWEGYWSALEAMQGVNATFTMDDSMHSFVVLKGNSNKLVTINKILNM